MINAKRQLKAMPVVGQKPIVDQSLFHERLYTLISNIISQQRRSPGKSKYQREQDAKKLFEAIIETLFRYALQSGYYRFPKGWGSLIIKATGPAIKRLPSGESITLKDRSSLKYMEGLAIRDILGKRDIYKGRKNKRTSSLDGLLKEIGIGGI